MLSRNHCCYGKVASITYSDCVSVTLVIQHAKCIRFIILSFLACLSVHVSIVSHKWHDFQKVVFGCRMCILVFSTTFVWNLSLSRNNSAVYYRNNTYISVLRTIILVTVMWIFFNRFSDITHISNFLKICPVGTEMFQVYDQAERHDEAHSPFLQFMKVLNKVVLFTWSFQCCVWNRKLPLTNHVVFVLVQRWKLCISQ